MQVWAIKLHTSRDINYGTFCNAVLNVYLE